MGVFFYTSGLCPSIYPSQPQIPNRGSLAIVSGGFNDSKVGPGEKKLKNEFAASGYCPYDEHSPFPVYPTTLPHTAENNK